MASPDEREFVTFQRGHIRDAIILAAFRNSLRVLVNPKTGQLFTEDEVQRATQPGSRFYIEADAIDLYGQTQQSKALWLADQVDPRRASSRMLREYHGALWLPAGPLPAVGASGEVLGKGADATAFVGSTTMEDPTALRGSDPNGSRYQLLQSVVLGPAKQATFLLRAIDAGFATNIPIGTVITWTENLPVGGEPTAVVQETTGYPGTGFRGGFDEETDQEFARRVEDQMRDRPGAGNPAHFQSWSQEANSAVEQAFVYSVALHAGSVLVAITQRRNQHAEEGPLGRFPSGAVLLDVRAYLTPPGSAVVPQRVFVLVTGPQSQPVDVVLRVNMNQGSGGGWSDVRPWPNPPPTSPASDTEVVAITTVTSQVNVTVNGTALLPGGAASLSGLEAPALMVWDDGRSRFERLNVTSVTDGGSSKTIALASAPSKTLAVGDRICPYTDRATEIAEAVEAYFDALGPGELVSSADPRWARGARKPGSQVRYPMRASTGLATAVASVLGAVARDVELLYLSRNAPDLPGSVSDGPNMLTVGKVTVYPEGV